MHYVSYSTWENGSGRRLNGCLLSIRPTVSTFALFFFMFYHPLVAEPQNTALRHGGSYGAASAVNWLGNHQLHIIPDLLVVLLLLAYIADTSNITFPKEPSTSNSIFYLIYHTPGRTSSILLKKSRIKGIQPYIKHHNLCNTLPGFPDLQSTLDPQQNMTWLSSLLPTKSFLITSSMKRVVWSMKRTVCREAKTRKPKGAMLFDRWDTCDRK